MVRQTLAVTLPCPGDRWIDPPFAPLTLRVSPILRPSELRDLHSDVRRAGRPTHQGLRRLLGSERPARQDVHPPLSFISDPYSHPSLA